MILVVDDDDDPFDLSYYLDLLTRDNHLDTSSLLDFEIVAFERMIQRYLKNKNRFKKNDFIRIFGNLP